MGLRHRDIDHVIDLGDDFCHLITMLPVHGLGRIHPFPVHIVEGHQLRFGIISGLVDAGTLHLLQGISPKHAPIPHDHPLWVLFPNQLDDFIKDLRIG